MIILLSASPCIHSNDLPQMEPAALISTRAFSPFGIIALFLVTFCAFWVRAAPALSVESFESLVRFDPESTLIINHSAWTTFLGSYVTSGADGLNRVAYNRITAEDKQGLEAYIHTLEAIDVPRYNRNEQFAFWANLYNAVTVNLVIDAYPVTSIRKIKSGAFSFGPWAKKRIQVGRHALSLDDVEHGILRASWRDPRIHYALNCASVSCPNLALQAYSGQTLGHALDASARAYINHPRGAQIEQGQLTVSSIYEWYVQDFGNSDQGVIQHLQQFAEGAFAQELASVQKISGHGYDWSLNDMTGQ